jgi:hypothetical protein
MIIFAMSKTHLIKNNSKYKMEKVMRNFRKFSLLLVFMSISVLLFSCKDDEDPVSSSASDLVGTWSLTKVIIPALGNAEITLPFNGYQQVAIVLNSDKTINATIVDTAGTHNYNGTWSEANGKVSMSVDNFPFSLIDIPYEINGNTLSVETTITYEAYGGDIPVKLVFTKQ